VKWDWGLPACLASAWLSKRPGTDGAVHSSAGRSVAGAVPFKELATGRLALDS
jgi:hypothetical protein